MKQHYTTIQKYNLDEILPSLGTKVDVKSRIKLKTDSNEIFNVKVASLRLVTFKVDGISCCYCGINATHFQLEYTGNVRQPHLNMYSNNLLMTKEHYIPKSKGGKDHISNMKTCCTECNELRGNLELPSIK